AQVYHLAQAGAAARSGETMDVSMPNGTVQVNRASPAELDQLPGVGPALAQEIIAEREKNGFFHYPEDLVGVRGIGPKTLERMREQLRLP
ncbi:MAG: ComEA family DNA-binding protein, partial [Clostridia bacterium]|nr:ComEA family DNA-binding protein [Clostridia bacterium]